MIELTMAIIWLSVLLILAGEIWHSLRMKHILLKINAPQKEIRLKAVNALSRRLIWKNDAEVVKLLLKSYSEPEWEIRHKAIKSLSNALRANASCSSQSPIFDYVPKIIEALLTALADTHTEVQAIAAKELQNIKDSSTTFHILKKKPLEASLPSLLHVSKTQKDIPRSEAIRFLGYTKDMRAIPALLAALQDTDMLIRKRARVSLKNTLNSVHAVTFGKKGLKILDPAHTLCDPDVTNLTIPMLALREIYVLSTTSQHEQIAAFTYYLRTCLGKKYLKKCVSVHLHGNIGRFEPELYAPFALCKKVHVYIKRLVFGQSPAQQDNSLTTLQNPDLSSFPLPLSYLERLDVDVHTCNMYQLEQFFTYAVNYIGQKRLKTTIDVHIYGDHTELNPNIRNNFINLCKQVHTHDSSETSNAQ